MVAGTRRRRGCSGGGETVGERAAGGAEGCDEEAESQASCGDTGEEANCAGAHVDIVLGLGVEGIGREREGTFSKNGEGKKRRDERRNPRGHDLSCPYRLGKLARAALGELNGG